MIFKILILFIGLINLPTSLLFAKERATIKSEESDQQIGDFSLGGYGEKGKKTWDISGKTADIFTEIIKLESVVGNLYGKEEDVKLTADRGVFNKTDGKVHLEQNVVITTSSGAKLTTDSLDWNRKEHIVTTKDNVNIERENIMAQAIGARGETDLKKVSLEKEVRVDINSQAEDNTGKPGAKEKIIITCDGPLEIDYEKNIASFNNNVKVERQDSVIYSDKMDVFFRAKEANEPEKISGFMGSKVEKIIARGNVRVVRGDNISYSEEAIYTASDKKIVLSGRPKLIISSTEELKNAPIGN